MLVGRHNSLGVGTGGEVCRFRLHPVEIPKSNRLRSGSTSHKIIKMEKRKVLELGKSLKFSLTVMGKIKLM